MKTEPIYVAFAAAGALLCGAACAIYYMTGDLGPDLPVRAVTAAVTSLIAAFDGALFGNCAAELAVAVCKRRASIRKSLGAFFAQKRQP